MKIIESLKGCDTLFLYKIAIVLFLGINVYSLEKNPFFDEQYDLFKFMYDFSAFQGEFSEVLYEYLENPNEVNLKIVYTKLPVHKYDQDRIQIIDHCHCQLFEEDPYIYYNMEKDTILEGYGKIGSVNFKKNKQIDEYDIEKIKRLKFCVRFFIKYSYQVKINKIYNKALVEFKNRQKQNAANLTLDVIEEKCWIYLPITSESVAMYNDFGFFLEQGGEYSEAVKVLKEVITIFPKRTVAYLNLADAYFGLQNKEKAKESYLTYIDLMKKNAKEEKIPKRVFERVK